MTVFITLYYTHNITMCMDGIISISSKRLRQTPAQPADASWTRKISS